MAHMEYGGNKCIITFLVPINFLAILNLHAPRFIFVIWCVSPNPTGPSCIMHRGRAHSTYAKEGGGRRGFAFTYNNS